MLKVVKRLKRLLLYSDRDWGQVDGAAVRGYNIGVRAARLPTTPKTMALPPLTIRKPETLATRLDTIENETVETALGTNQKTTYTVRINGATVDCTVTPAVRPGRLYRLFYVDGKRFAKGDLPGRLLKSN